VNKTTVKDEVIEVIKRNKGDIKFIIDAIDNEILIYSILKTDKSIVKSQRYESLSIELQELKTSFQIELQEYLKNKKVKKFENYR